MCVHSVDGGEVGLHSLQLFVPSAHHVSALLKGTAPIALPVPPVKQRLMA